MTVPLLFLWVLFPGFVQNNMQHPCVTPIKLYQSHHCYNNCNDRIFFNEPLFRSVLFSHTPAFYPILFSYPFIGVMGRVFPNGPGPWVQSQVVSYQRL